MDKIRILRDGVILAHHTTESYLSSYGQPVWVIEDENPHPGAATWEQGENRQELEIIEKRGGWLIVRQADGYLAGILWSDGSYHAELLEDKKGFGVKRIDDGYRIPGSIKVNPENPHDLGAMLF